MEKITKTASQVLEELRTSESGLSKAEAQLRLKQNGPNRLPEPKVDGIFIIFLRQFKSSLIYILLAAVAVLALMGEMTDAVLIFIVVIFNAVVGTIQEGKAQNTLLALKKFTETYATVLRDGQEVILKEEELVVGDVIILQEGEKVPADARIIFSNNLLINEAAMTGESLPVHKNANGDGNNNSAFMGTFISAGNGRAVVTATGKNTFIGGIAEKISVVDTEVPLKANIRNLSRVIIILVGILAVVLFTIGILEGRSVREMFFTAVILSVSVIPEGLTIVMTLILATGVWRMGKKNALVKKLQAVEALGQAQVIAVDKTGTLTKNEMMVRQVYAGGELFDVSGAGYESKGEIALAGKKINFENFPQLSLAGSIASLAAGAKVVYSTASQVWQVAGDPTEAALLVFAKKIGLSKDQLLKESPVVFELPFDYKLKFHALVIKSEAGNKLIAVGAPEVILERSSNLNEKDRQEWESVFLRMSESGLRVVAFAEKTISIETIGDADVNDLDVLGFYGIQDSLRPEVAQAMRDAKSAGIRVVMITGDHRVTAAAIAREAGIYHAGDLTIEGAQLDQMTAEELSSKLDKVSVFARVTPDHKMKIIQAYREKGIVVAMTGDGVNDAPSLVAADLGVSMGKIGTEVAKEAADIVLLDDNFGSIIAAVEEGRNIYKTLKKVILYLFSTNLGEVMVVTSALLLGIPLPLLPAQIIWLNLVTDGFLDVALAMEPKEEGLLAQGFERPKKYLVDRLMGWRMFFMAVPMTIGTMTLFILYLPMGITKALTVSLTTMAVFQWFNAWNCRSEDRSVFATNPFSNLYLVGATIIVILLQMLAVYTPFLQKFLKTQPLSLADWQLIVPVAFSIVIVEETRKFFYRRKKKSAAAAAV